MKQQLKRYRQLLFLVWHEVKLSKVVEAVEMESKHQSNGVARNRSAKDVYVQGSHGNDAKGSSVADHKGVQMIPGVDFSQEKAILREIEQDMDADDEFERLKNTPTEVAPAIAPTKFAKNFVNGFKIISMNMRDTTTGRLLWKANNWTAEDMFNNEIKEEIPKEVLKCKGISREIEFHSDEQLNGFRLQQRVYFMGTCIEEWFFSFGFVMPNSTNSWQQTIDAAAAEDMLSAEALSGNVVFETSFYDGDEFMCKNSVRIYYV